MFERTLRCLLLALLAGCATQKPSEPVPRLPEALAAAPFEPSGLGSLEARSSAGDSSLLSLKSAQVVAVQRGDMAEVEATHTFVNESDSVLEGTFRFPMPEGALLTGLAMMIDGKLMEGELVEREKARKIYQEIVDGMQDPALLEWEHGSIFKMRVFPIEPRSNKVVKIRYLTPLHRTAGGLELVQAARAIAGSEPLPELSIDFDGKRVFSEKNVAPGRVISVKAKPISPVLREKRADGVYSAVRISPDWSRVPGPSKPPAKNWFVLVDTSRSALEELPRQLEALEVVLSHLPPQARFQVLVSDLDVRPAPQGSSDVSPAAVAAAVDFVKGVAPDGASDLGHAFEVVGALVRATPDSAVLYIGDCEPTWGLTRTRDLLALGARELPQVPFYSLMFGASVNEELAADLAQQSGGRRAHVRRREDLEAFAKTLPSGVPTLDAIEVKLAAGTELLPSGPLSLEKGRELTLLLKAPVGRDPLAGLSVKAKLLGKALDLTPRAAAQDTDGIAKRYGAALVRKLEKADSPPKDVIEASLDYGVISKLTSFLVLESEEAYARFAIERKNARTAEAPRVTGANLETADATDISADRIQPGDPEIYVDAERDALSVKVEFPFGETKVARYDLEARGGRGAWMVRFLVARDTPEGDYDALAQIVHRDGSSETKKVRYTVDNTAPELSVTLERSTRRPGMTEVFVSQPKSDALSDLKRVELRTPSGAIYQLVAISWGTFRVFVPTSELGGGTLRVVGFDQALNHRVKELVLQ